MFLRLEVGDREEERMKEREGQEKEEKEKRDALYSISIVEIH